MSQIVNLSTTEEDEMKIYNKLLDYNSGFWEIENESKFTILEINEDEEIIDGIVWL